MNRYELLRYEHGWTRAELAARSGVSERTIRYLEAEDGRPSAPTARKLADVFQVTVAELLGVEPTETEAA